MPSFEGTQRDNRGDLLTAYNGKSITYDEIGNPLNDGIWSYTWEHGRQLASMTSGNTTWAYRYNLSGLRERRSNGSITYNYVKGNWSPKSSKEFSWIKKWVDRGLKVLIFALLDEITMEMN